MTIVLHSRRIIFVRAKKVASTSFEFALSGLSGPQDIVTPIGLDRKTRAELASPPKNFQFTHNELFKSGNITALLKSMLTLGQRRPWKYDNHMSAADIKTTLGSDVYDKYFKISIVRNPYSVAASIYYYIHNSRSSSDLPDFTRWLTENTSHINTNHQYYFIGSRLAVDYVIRFEHLEQDLNRLCLLRPELAAVSSLMLANRLNPNSLNFRRPASELFMQHPLAAELVRQCCQLQFSSFGYSTDPARAEAPPPLVLIAHKYLSKPLLSLTGCIC